MTKLLTPERIAELTSFHVDSVYRWLRAGEIPGATKIGGRWRVSQQGYEAWIGVEGGATATNERSAEPSFGPALSTTTPSKVSSLASWRALRPEVKEDTR